MVVPCGLLFNIEEDKGPWVAELVKFPTLDFSQVVISGLWEPPRVQPPSSRALGSTLGMEPVYDSLSLCPPHFPVVHTQASTLSKKIKT